MKTISTTTEQLNDLIAMTNEGQRFYEHAKEEEGDKAIGH
jgi:hypothetical protein